MRISSVALFASAAIVVGAAASAADQLRYGKQPLWVTPQAIPDLPADADDAPLLFLLSDQQLRVEPGKVTTFAQTAIRVQTSEGLQVGNLSIPWDPARQTVTIHKLEIHREGKIIDILAGGQQFTTLRREQNLEAATLDGLLTANIQPEGLQVGDTLVLSSTVEHSDPVMKGNVEIAFGAWNGVPISMARSKILWPETMNLHVRAASGLPKALTAADDGLRSYEITDSDVQPILVPKGVPGRFQLGRYGEATTFRSWSEVADLMRPLYKAASAVPTSGSLRDEVEKIRSSTPDPVVRAEKALDLVEHRVRYVALLMGQGGYVPATAAETWSRRFGDCKAKTALLLAILGELGIESEPVLVNVAGGDGLDQRLPMVAHFNHVIVRARIAGKTHWLDGTRLGDAKLDTIATPAFHWGLPLVADAQLVRMLPAPLDTPDSERKISIDAAAGLFATAPMTVEQIYRGDEARGLNQLYAKITAAQREQMMREFWKEEFNFASVEEVNSSYDAQRAEIRLTMKGKAKLDWQDGWLYVPGSSLAFQPNFERSSGPLQQAPVRVAYPFFARTRVEMRMPESFIKASRSAKMPDAVQEKLAGVEYGRTVQLTGNRLIVETSERSTVPEVDYKVARAAEGRLKAIYDTDVNLRVPAGYQNTAADLAAVREESPTTAQGYLLRGSAFIAATDFERAIDDFDEAVRLDGKNPLALTQRAMAKALKRDFEGAEADTKAALALDSANLAAVYAQAMIAGLKGDRKGALALLTKLLKKDPRNLDALRQRASEYLVDGRIEDAEKDMTAIAAIDPNDSGLSRLRMQLAFQKGDRRAGLEMFASMIDADPQNADLYFGRAQSLIEAGERDKAMPDLDRALRLRPEYAEARLARANILKVKGDRDGALKEADALMASEAKKSFPLVAAAKLYAAFDRHQDAMKAFDKALALGPEAYIYINRAQSRPRSDRDSRLADLDQALKLEPENKEALYFKSRILWSAKDWTETAILLERLEALAPEEAEYYRLGRAVVLHLAGKMAEADELFTELGKAAKSAQQYNSLCWEKATADIRLDSALEDCRKAVGLSPDSPAYLDSLGMVLLRLGKLDEALAAYDRAIARHAGSSSLMGRALVKAAKGEMQGARLDAAEARKVNSAVDSEFEGYGLKFAEAIAAAN